MTTLLLVRHGETDWNRARRIQGTTDVPLNDTGRAQARAAAEAVRTLLRGEQPWIASSDLSRARETAELLAAELGATLAHTYPDLRERDYGEAEGVHFDEYVARWGEWAVADAPGAEPREELRRRAVRGLRRVVRDVRRETAPSARSVVVVSHGGVLREIIGHASGGALPPAGERIANGAVYPFLLEREHLRLLAEVTAS